MGEICTRTYRKGEVVARDFPLADVSDHLEQRDTVVWVDFSAPTAEQIHDLAGELGLHELGVEDALGPHQRPKLDDYVTHQFLSCQAVQIDVSRAALVATEIDAFVGDRWLITVRKGEGFSMDPVLQRWDRAPELTAQGVSFMVYALLDVVIDGYFDVVQSFDEFYDEVSDQIFAERPLEPSDQRHWFQMRRALVQFHRLVVPMRELVSSFMRRERGAVGEDVYPYFQDVYDHTLRVSESTDSLRDLVSTIVETNLSLRDYRQNLIVKKVSSWAAIIAVPALVTGYYGMNVPFPGFARQWGAIASAAIMLVAVVGLYVVFRRRNWL
jgi:magnesium transporter